MCNTFTLSAFDLNNYIKLDNLFTLYETYIYCPLKTVTLSFKVITKYLKKKKMVFNINF